MQRHGLGLLSSRPRCAACKRTMPLHHFRDYTAVMTACHPLNMKHGTEQIPARSSWKHPGPMEKLLLKAFRKGGGARNSLRARRKSSEGKCKTEIPMKIRICTDLNKLRPTATSHGRVRYYTAEEKHNPQRKIPQNIIHSWT